MLELLRAPWTVEPTDRWPGLFDVYDCEGNVVAAAKIEEVAEVIAKAPLLEAMLQVGALGILGDLAKLANLGLCPDCGEPWPITETIRADGSLGCPCQEVANELSGTA